MVWWFPCAVSMASEIPEIAVVGVHDDTLDIPAQLEANKVLADAITASGRARPLLGSPLLDMLEGHEEQILREAFVRPGAQQLQDGRLLFNQGTAEGAVPVLREAIASLTEAMRVVDAREALWTSWMVLAACHLALDENPMAVFAVGQALALDRERVPDPTQFAPDLLRLFESTKREREKFLATLAVSVPDNEATLFLDGQPVGKTPYKADILSGTHHIRGRGIDGTRDSQILNVAPEDDVKVELVLRPPRLIRAPEAPFARARQIDLLYRALSEHSQAELALLVGVSGRQVQIQVYDGRLGMWSQPTSVPYFDSPVDEAVATMPLVLAQLDALGEMNAISASIIPMDAGTNGYVTRLLLEPGSGDLRTAPVAVPVPVTPERTLPKWVVPVAAGGGGAVAVGVTVGVLAAVLSKEPPPEVDPNQGVVLFGPVP